MSTYKYSYKDFTYVNPLVLKGSQLDIPEGSGGTVNNRGGAEGRHDSEYSKRGGDKLVECWLGLLKGK